MMLCFLFISYWLNKIILAIVFWVLVFFVLFLIVLIYSIIYCLCGRKRIEQQEEEERQRNIEERYRYDNDNDSEEGNNENNSIESSTSQTRVVLKQLINSMKKSFTINHKYSKQSATSCSICFIDFVEKDTVIELKCDTKHTFHDACLHAWTREHDTCPLCRKRIES